MPAALSEPRVSAWPAEGRTNLAGLSRSSLEQWVETAGIKRFHARQLLKWLCHHGVTDFAAMTNLSSSLRAWLGERAELLFPPFAEEHQSADGTCKWLLDLAGGGRVETVFIPAGRRGTLCISSQAGCTLNCSFCATGQQGFQRNLDSAEIFGQVWRAHQALDAFSAGSGRRITNVVLMGMGEPLLNFDAVATAISLLLDDLSFGLPRRRVTVSTAGVAPAIERIPAEMGGAALAVSLHAAEDGLRNELVPLNRKYPIADLLSACRAYLAGLPERGRTVTFEYTLLAGVNDSPAQAGDLARLLRSIPCKINLIPFNPIPGSRYRRPEPMAVNAFQQRLSEAGQRALIRATRGDDIAAACGQLVGTVLDRTKRSLRILEN